MNNNSTLLNALLNGNSKVIQGIYKDNFPKVKNFVLQNKGQKQDAEDIFQMALLQLASRYKKEKFVIHSSFEAYLFTVCKNLWRRNLNKSKIKVTNKEIFELKDESTDMALALLEQKRWEVFQIGLKKISENCQQILKMFFNKVPYSEMVKKMNYNSETVARQRVFKCKAKLAEVIKNDKNYQALKEL